MAARTKPAKRAAARKRSPVPPEGTPVEVKKTDELWSKYDLADGTVLRIRPVVVEVRHVKGQYSSTGDPLYSIKTAIIADVQAPAKLKRKTK